MCGRFSLSMSLPELQAAFPWADFGVENQPRYNIAPTQPVLALPNLPDKKARLFRWGLIPGWAKDAAIGHRLLNARAETLAEKPSFRQAFRRRRCLIPADGFFEWKKEKNGKVPYHIRLKNGGVFAMAGLWEEWQPPDGAAVFSCTIITTMANEAIRTIHDRMPVILQPADYTVWLDPLPQPVERFTTLFDIFPADALTAIAVSSKVNNPRNEGPDVLRPLADQDRFDG
jgi:putative SOS response-associated peptidase YedK